MGQPSIFVTSLFIPVNSHKFLLSPMESFQKKKCNPNPYPGLLISITLLHSDNTALTSPFCFQNLLSLLRLGSGKGEASYLHLQGVSCLRQLCVGLRRRLRFHQHPSFYSTKQGGTAYEFRSFYRCFQSILIIYFTSIPCCFTFFKYRP